MSRQTLIIGLGQFGRALARALADHGGEVLAVDLKRDLVEDLAPFVEDALVLDATDEAALASLAPASRDTCICAIGDENKEGSILVTALLRQLGAKQVIARASDPLHARILSLVGAHEVVNPERDFGERLATRLAWRNVVNVLPLGEGLVLTELRCPQVFWGRTLTELALPVHHQVMVAAIRRHTASGVVTSLPNPQRPLQEGDMLMVVGIEADVQRLTERV